MNRLLSEVDIAEKNEQSDSDSEGGVALGRIVLIKYIRPSRYLLGIRGYNLIKLG